MNQQRQHHGTIPMAVYHNPTSKPIAFRIGTVPGMPPEEYVVGPGEELQGPANYVRFYKRQGLLEGPSPAKAASKAKAKAEEDAMAGVPPRGR